MNRSLSVLLLAGVATASFAQQPNFGVSVDISDREIMVGQPTNSDAPGAVLVFQRSLSGSGWDVNATLTASDGKVGDAFGSTLTVEGTRLAVGAPNANGGKGAVYVFERQASSGAWTETAHLTESDASDQRQIGGAIALMGDMLMVGAVGAGGGSVLLFQGSTDGWNQQAILTPSGEPQEDGFGSAVVADGDRIYVGAPFRDGGKGGVYVFRHTDGTYTQENVLSESSADIWGTGNSLLVPESGVVVAGAPGFGPNPQMGENDTPPQPIFTIWRLNLKVGNNCS